MNDDMQGAVPFSPQESALELEEQALEGVTGGGRFTNFLKGCVACGAPKASETPEAEPEGRVLTIAGSSPLARSQAQFAASRLQSESGHEHSVVQQGRNTYVVSPARR